MMTTMSAAAALPAARIAPGATGAAAAPADAAAAPERRNDGGIVVNDHPFVRKLLMGSGFAVAGGAGMAYALSRTPVLQKGGIMSSGGRVLPFVLGAAGVGASLVAGSMLVRPKFVPYMTGTIDSADEAYRQAAGYDRDIGVHEANGRYGLIDLRGKDVDNDGPASVRLGNKDVRFHAYATRDGDLLVRGGRGTFENRGAYPRPAVDLTRARMGAELERQLEGAQIGTDADHNPLALAKRMSTNQDGFANSADAARWAFEGAHERTAVVKVGDRFHVFEVKGPSDLAGVRTRGTQVAPWGAVQVVQGTTTAATVKPGEALRSAPIPKLDLGSIAAGDAASLTGRRIGATQQGQVVRLGPLLGNKDGYASAGSAGAELFEQAERPDDIAVLKVADKWFAYAVQGGAIASDNAQHLLGPPERVRVMRGSHLHAIDQANRLVAGEGLPRVDLAGIPADQVPSLAGRRLGVAGGAIVRLGPPVGTPGGHATAAAAQAEAYQLGGQLAILHVGGSYALFALSGGVLGGSAATLLGPDARVELQQGKKVYRASGQQWAFNRRSIPFDPAEPVGATVFGGHRVGRHVAAVSSRAEAMGWLTSDQAVEQLRGGAAWRTAIEGTGGAWHLYELHGSGGGAWDEELGNAIGMVSNHHEERSFHDEHRTSPENWSSAYVDYVEQDRRWVAFNGDDGSRDLWDTGWDETERRRDGGRTSSLQSELRREWEAELERRRREAEEAERRRREAEEAAERARQAAEAEERRRAEERRNQSTDSGGSGGSSGSGSSGGYTGGSGGSGSGGSGGAGSNSGGSRGQNSDGDF